MASEKLLKSSWGLKNILVIVGEGTEIVFYNFSYSGFYTDKLYYCLAGTYFVLTRGRWSSVSGIYNIMLGKSKIQGTRGRVWQDI